MIDPGLQSAGVTAGGPDFAGLFSYFAGIGLWFSVFFIVFGLRALHQGHPADLLTFLFMPVLFGVSSFGPLIGHVCRMEGKQKALSLTVLAVMLGAGVYQGIRLHERIEPVQVREKWQVLLEQRRFAEALPYVEEAYRTHRGDFRYADPMALTYMSLGRRPEAIEVLESLRRTQGKLSAYETRLLAFAYLTPGFLYQSAGNWPKALENAKKAIEIKPDLPQAYELAGLAARKIQGPQSAEARAYYARLIQLLPDPRQTAFIKKLYPDLFQKSK